MLEVGAAMPVLTVLDDGGARVSTQDLLGQTLVLWFYPKDDTPG